MSRKSHCGPIKDSVLLFWVFAFCEFYSQAICVSAKIIFLFSAFISFHRFAPLLTTLSRNVRPGHLLSTQISLHTYILTSVSCGYGSILSCPHRPDPWQPPAAHVFGLRI